MTTENFEEEIIPEEEAKASRVVWIRVGALGDLLVSLQALESSLKRFPNAKFWIIGSKLWTEILDPKLWPRIDGILVCEYGSKGVLFEPHTNKWIIKSPFITAQELYKQAHATINLRIESYRFAWGPVTASVPIRIGSCPPATKFFYTHWYPWLGKEPQIHERDWYDGVCKASKGRSKKPVLLGELKKTGLPRLTLEAQDKNKIESLWGLKDKSFIIVNPSASREEKTWPKENFKRLVAELSNKVQTVVVGAPSETDWLQFVAGGKVRVIQPSHLRDLFELVAAAKFIVCNTSSLQFVAAAQKTKALVLMGLTSPLRWGPLGSEDLVVEAPVKPTDKKLNLFKRERLAYESIAYEQVWARIGTWL